MELFHCFVFLHIKSSLFVLDTVHRILISHIPGPPDDTSHDQQQDNYDHDKKMSPIDWYPVRKLFGFVNDEIQRRSKEIAIRKVNGAEVPDILRLVSGNIFWTALSAVLVGIVFAYIVSN